MSGHCNGDVCHGPALCVCCCADCETEQEVIDDLRSAEAFREEVMSLLRPLHLLLGKLIAAQDAEASR